jgi:hypothetical protein
MWWLIISVFISFFIAASASSQTLSKQAANDFFSDLSQESPDLDKWVWPDEMAISRRLGIAYSGVKHKFLISYELGDGLKAKTTRHQADFKVRVVPLEADYSKLIVEKGGISAAEYFFVHNRLVSPVYYHSRHWTRFESDYFKFFISDPARFNQYCGRRLDGFVSDILDVLEISSELKARLGQEKIYYFLCRDTGEIEALTGFDTRGMYNLAYDYVISQFNCHYHEIVHLLVNYKLQQVPLRTHPFFQEGLAVALGGRGGKEPPIILDLGWFLFWSGFLQLPDLLSLESFRATDATLSYPASGLYNLFLINQFGVDTSLGLYRKYSLPSGPSTVAGTDLPEIQAWESFLRHYPGPSSSGQPAAGPAERQILFQNPEVQISLDSNTVFFKLSAPVMLSEPNIPEGYVSTEFYRQFPDRIYQGEKYLITANPDEVSMYNLYTNNLAVKYVASMSIDRPPIEQDGSYCLFKIDRSVFDSELSGMTVKVLPAVEKPE